MMNAFDEYLMDWEFGEEWRPVVERLAARCTTWPRAAPEPDDFCVDFPVDVLWRDGLLVWVYLVDPVRNVVDCCLGGQFDRTGLRCGTLNPHNPGDHLDCHFMRPGDMGSLKALADEFVDWITRETELWRGNHPVLPESA
ncbi:hypothetical protein [Streptomyces sp. NPDC057582]|uniref:hypothetical protein n=1 Tax=unclassified Streptomyces TaxID=2593676 RepID=UPI0036B863D0